MPSTNADFQARWRTEVVLPSGLSVAIRKVQAWDFLDLGELPMPSQASTPDDPGEPAVEQVSLLRKYTQRAIARGVLEPPMTDDEAQHGDALFYVGYLDTADAEALALAILQWAGLTAEAAAAVDTFRLDPLSPADSGLSGALPRPSVDAVAALT